MPMSGFADSIWGCHFRRCLLYYPIVVTNFQRILPLDHLQPYRTVSIPLWHKFLHCNLNVRLRTLFRESGIAFSNSGWYMYHRLQHVGTLNVPKICICEFLIILTIHTTNSHIIRYVRFMREWVIWYDDIFVYCNWVDTRWQKYSTHLHKNNTQNNTIDTKKYIEYN
jgi:hypothetical protein